MKQPRCSDEWDEDTDEADLFDLFDTITRIEWREQLSDDLTYEDFNDDTDQGNC